MEWTTQKGLKTPPRKVNLNGWREFNFPLVSCVSLHNVNIMEVQPGWLNMPPVIGRIDFADYRDGPMCGAATFATYRSESFCRICQAKGRNPLHELVERRYRCRSPVCLDEASIAAQDASIDDATEGDSSQEEVLVCPVIWKVQHCTEHDEWIPRVNFESHLRGALPCVVGLPQLTDAMRESLRLQDEWSIPPRAILVNMMSDPLIQEPRRGWPTPMQVNNALKTIRRTQGTKNSIMAIQAYARKHSYRVDIPMKQVFIFGTSQGSDGYPHVGSGESNDPFLLGISSIRFINDCIKFMKSGKFVVFHANATFKLSDLGYPVISVDLRTRDGRTKSPLFLS